MSDLYYYCQLNKKYRVNLTVSANLLQYCHLYSVCSSFSVLRLTFLLQLAFLKCHLLIYLSNLALVFLFNSLKVIPLELCIPMVSPWSFLLTCCFVCVCFSVFFLHGCYLYNFSYTFFIRCLCGIVKFHHHSTYHH